MNRVLKYLLPVLAMVFFAQPVLAQQIIDQRADMVEGGTLDVSNMSGSVTILGWDREEIHVTGELGDAAHELEFKSDGRNARIKVVMRSKRHYHDDEAADLTIKVPASTRIKVTTVSADITVDRTNGALRLHSVSGDVEARIGRADDVEVQTVSGDVEIHGEGHKSRLTLTLVSGDADVRGISGEVSVHTVSGEVEVEADTLERVKLNSTSGDIGLRSQLSRGAQLDSASISGDVLLRLCNDIDAEFELSSFSGDIDSVDGTRARRTSEFGPGKELRKTRGSGAGRIAVNTMSGDIEFGGC